MVQTRLVCAAWRQGRLSIGQPEILSDYPARPDRPLLVDAKGMKYDCNVTVEVEMLHALAHIELGAMDNYWDTIVRFDPEQYQLPKSFYDDFVSVVDDEAKHFGWLVAALNRRGSAYGNLLAHKGLLEHSANTKDDLLARLAVIPLVQEARGLDAGPRLVHKLSSSGARESAQLVRNIVADEVNHVRHGIRWFKYCCSLSGLDHTTHFHHLVLQYFPQGLPGPFSASDRLAAGMPPDFFMPVSRDHLSKSVTNLKDN
jgi:uncharacterized ferritin-like protein (DUF455 family)